MGWRRGALIGLVLAGLVPRRPNSEGRPLNNAAADAALAEFTSPTLTLFSGEEEFRRYLGAVLAARRARGLVLVAGGRHPVRPGTAAGRRPVGHGRADLPRKRSAMRGAGQRRRQHCRHRQSRRAPANRRSAPSPRSAPPRRTRRSPTTRCATSRKATSSSRSATICSSSRTAASSSSTFAAYIRRLALADRMNVYRDARHFDMWYDEMLVLAIRVRHRLFLSRGCDRIVGLSSST